MACRNYIIEQPLNINPWVPERVWIKIYDLETYSCSLHIKAPIVWVNAATFEQRKQPRCRAKCKQPSYGNKGIFSEIPERLAGRGMATGGQQANIVTPRLGAGCPMAVAGLPLSPCAGWWDAGRGSEEPALLLGCSEAWEETTAV